MHVFSSEVITVLKNFGNKLTFFESYPTAFVVEITEEIVKETFKNQFASIKLFKCLKGSISWTMTSKRTNSKN